MTPDLTAITSRRAQVLCELSRQRTQEQIAQTLQISPATVRSHIDWLRQHTARTSMRELGEWWQEARGTWLCEMALAAGLRIGTEAAGDGIAGRIKMGPMGGLILPSPNAKLESIGTPTEG